MPPSCLLENGQSGVEKNITIDQLAKMMNEGFKSTATKEDINRVEVRMGGIESR